MGIPPLSSADSMEKARTAMQAETQALLRCGKRIKQLEFLSQHRGKIQVIGFLAATAFAALSFTSAVLLIPISLPLGILLGMGISASLIVGIMGFMIAKGICREIQGTLCLKRKEQAFFENRLAHAAQSLVNLFTARHPEYKNQG